MKNLLKISKQNFSKNSQNHLTTSKKHVINIEEESLEEIDFCFIIFYQSFPALKKNHPKLF